MADLPPQIPPSPAVTPASPVTATVSELPIATTIVSLPDTMAQVVRQVEIAATLAVAPTTSTVSLASSLGPLTVSLAKLAGNQQQAAIEHLITLFGAQKPLTVIINPGAPPTQAFLFIPQSFGAPPSTQSGLLSRALPVAVGSIAHAQPSSPIGVIAVGSIASAVVLPSALNTPGASSTSSSVRATSLSLSADSVSGTNTPAVPSMPVTPTPLATTIAPAGQLSLTQPSSITAVPTPPPHNILPPGQEINLQFAAIALPNSPAPIPALSNQFLATVIGTGTNGELIVKIGDNSVFVKQTSDLPIGTQLLVTVALAKDTALTTLPLSAPDFPALQQSFATLIQIVPQLSQQILQNHLPQPMNAFPASLLFMMTAMKQGNIRGWLGDEAVNALERAGKFELLSKLAQETSQPGRAVQDGVVGQWQSYPVPIFAQNQVQLMSLYVHRDTDQHSSGKTGLRAGSFVRFVIDVNFSKIGPMQLDGFVQAKKLDMIVRSEKILPDGLAPDLRDSYRLAMESVGFAGTLSFQFGRKGWMTFRDNPMAATLTT